MRDSKENPLFSVLIANYNNGKYLQEAIDSVLAQTYTNWEIILVDDKSTDNSFDIYKKYELDSRFHIFYNEENKGCGYSKHRCVEFANGEFCGFLDPDDVLLPIALKISVDSLSNSSDISLAFSRFYECDEKLQILSCSRSLLLKDGESYFEHHDYRAEHFASFRKSKYMLSSGIDVTLKAGVDADLYFKLEEHGVIFISDEITYKYRRCKKSVSSNWQYALYWNIFVRHNVCIRRGLPVEQFSYCDYKKYIEEREDYVVDVVQSSCSYKLGALILYPLHILKRFLHV